jgi:hypothetical protein
MTLASQLLDEFLETIETLPAELQSGFEELARIEQSLEDLYRSLHRKRILLLKNENGKKFDSTLQNTLLKRIEKEDAKGKQSHFNQRPPIIGTEN